MNQPMSGCDNATLLAIKKHGMISDQETWYAGSDRNFLSQG